MVIDAEPIGRRVETNLVQRRIPRSAEESGERGILSLEGTKTYREDLVALFPPSSQRYRLAVSVIEGDLR